MGIINSTESLIEYINGVNFSSVYVEENFPLAISGTFRTQAVNAVQYLLASAVVGNKAIGFFHQIPKISFDRPLRGICIFVSANLPEELETPVFFCRKPENITDIFPRALKTSADTNMPVQVIIAANILNNYMTVPFPTGDLDRVLPYLNNSTFAAKRNIHSTQQKLTAAYTALRTSIPQHEMPENMAFELTSEEFPLYIFPMKIPEQEKLFVKLKNIHTTEKNLYFFHKLIHILHDLDIDLSPDLQNEPLATNVYLCPGCPFAALYANLPLKDVIVFTSVRCEAVKNLYPVEQISITEYMGIVSRKLSVATLFVGNVSEALPVKNILLSNGTFVLMNDCGEKVPFPYISGPTKLKIVRNTVFPYSCKNIKKYSILRNNFKKCVCYKNNTSAECVNGSHCPAMICRENRIHINVKLCTGCRSCVPYCDKKAL
ncbi:MAG: hypothetical protein LBH05_03635 [Deferribacteraceae bacterium]|jgi:hypothetical protein|nr:hypothetical protein [Deferribacteraceae bacterium]